MPRPPSTPRTPRARPTVPGLLIVARDEVALYQALHRAFGGRGGIPVLRDRRQADRRQTVQPVPGDRRRAERRRPPRIEDDLQQRRYVVARPVDRLPHA